MYDSNGHLCALRRRDFPVSGPYKYGSKGNATRVQVGSAVILLCHDAVQLIADPEEFKEAEILKASSSPGSIQRAGRGGTQAGCNPTRL